ncbi:hypothetical protein SEA_MANEEKUL_53 [Streptomyces phage Maneekul]|uniref:Uncharacterized protein n=1 Tax=Streptomyces phage Yasdnil TaxID=2593360 RepID=A0A514U485_9CAUD|nr:hypothetical protein KGG98_gp53 [Streptomyces phage Yasdnil]AVE00436.1 hypothetical protein SEA_OZZYJ_55 [Streptomyces phage OzzyJ]AWN07421.1 hypothetical protein SEA_MANEEKUL_53 [Streptomyces phage Maneekul]QDK03777.1 hypothetical protein SEA_YASDNIL_53 [Streptomyces phage Yasdnil]UKH48555.1 hypothetical protein SEA_SNORLAX_53 [Streptomyces phage Snorlax]
MSQNTEPVAIVYGYHQARLFPEVKPENIIPFRLIHLLKDRAPSVIYRTGFGKSALAWRMLARLEEFAWQGTPIIHERQLREEVAA